MDLDRKNYFEVLKLSFDPPDPPQTIKKKLAQWKTEKEEQRNNSGDQSELNKLMELYTDMENVMLTPALRQQEAAQIKEERIAQLRKLIAIMLSGKRPNTTPEVTMTQIRSVAGHLGLRVDTVKQTYSESGYEIQKPVKGVSINASFLQPTIFSGLQQQIERLNNTNTPKYPWAAEVEDLFDLLCFFDGCTKKEKYMYKRKMTDELCAIARKYSIEIATDTSTPGHILGQLFSKATTQIFNSQENRRKYENSLEKYKHRDFFGLLSGAPEAFRKDPYFAEACITRIESIFPDRDLALAIYNSETKSLNDPYETPQAYIYVTCPSCRFIEKFRTREEAQRAKCPVCDSALYMNCPVPECRRRIPASAEKCPCGFSISEFRLYYDYCRLAKQALDDMDLIEAQRQFDNAKRANPFDTGISALGSRISELKREYEKPVRELQSLMDRQYYMGARKKLEQILSQNPKMNLTTQRQTIDSKLLQAQQSMPQNISDKYEQANQCIRVLSIVSDYSPAMELVRAVAPRCPGQVRAVMKNTGVRTACVLNWQSSGDLGVSYMIVRKDGAVPVDPDDGVILAGDITDTRFEDNTINAGQVYGYAVFAVRMGLSSPPTGCRTEVVMELDKRFLTIEARNGTCSFKWTLPQNCIGVRVLRTKGGIPSTEPDEQSRVVCERGQKGFEDKGLINNNPYTYRLQCIYRFGSQLRFSSGILTDPVIPEKPPCALQNITTSFKDKTVTVSWDECERKTDCIYIRKLRPGFDRDVIGQVRPMSEINGILDNNILATAYSSSRECRFSIRYGDSIQIAVVSESGCNGIISGVYHVVGVMPCEIDKTATRVEDGHLKAQLKAVSSDLERIHYIINEKTDKPVWGTEEDVTEGRSSWITPDEYKRNGDRLIIQRIPEKDLCFTVIGEYKLSDGTVILSQPSNMRINNKPKTEIRYRINWNRGFLGIKKDEAPVVEIECEETLPEMYLTCLENGQLPWSMKDEQLRILYTFPPTAVTDNKASLPLKDFDALNLEKGVILRLMISDEDMLEFNTVPLDTAHLKVP